MIQILTGKKKSRLTLFSGRSNVLICLFPFNRIHLNKSNRLYTYNKPAGSRIIISEGQKSRKKTKNFARIYKSRVIKTHGKPDTHYDSMHAHVLSVLCHWIGFWYRTMEKAKLGVVSILDPTYHNFIKGSSHNNNDFVS